MAGPATLYQSGAHGARPAASSGCVLFTCTDHDLVYRSDGSSWSTFITLSSGIADTTFDAKGDILSASADDTPAIVSAGPDGSVLLYDSGETAGIRSLKHNLAASAAPDADDDVDGGYEPGSVWVDTTNDEVYICVAASDGAAVWNQVGSGSATFVGAAARATSAQSVNNTTWTKVAFDTAEFDSGSFFDDANDRILPSAGKYVVGGSVVFAGANGTARYIAIRTKGVEEGPQVGHDPAPSTGQQISQLMDLDGTDYVELWVWHDHGAATDVGGTGDNVESRLWLVKVG